jgi:hypothetical protein
VILKMPMPPTRVKEMAASVVMMDEGWKDERKESTIVYQEIGKGKKERSRVNCSTSSKSKIQISTGFQFLHQSIHESIEGCDVVLVD